MAALENLPVVTTMPPSARESMTAECSFWTTGRPTVELPYILHSTTIRLPSGVRMIRSRPRSATPPTSVTFPQPAFWNIRWQARSKPKPSKPSRCMISSGMPGRTHGAHKSRALPGICTPSGSAQSGLVRPRGGGGKPHWEDVVADAIYSAARFMPPLIPFAFCVRRAAWRPAGRTTDLPDHATGSGLCPT